MHLPFAFLSPSFPTISKNHSKKKKKKQQEQVTKKFTEWKQVHVGMEPSKTSQTRWEQHHNTFTPSLRTSCAILLTMHTNKTLYMHLAYSHPLNEHGTHHCSLHSFPHKRQSISATFSSNKISLTTPNIPYRPSTAHSFCIQDRLYPAMLSSNYTAVTHNITHSPCTLKCHYTSSTTLHTASLHTTNKHKA